MQFLITGSTGLVGQQVVKDLTEKNHQVYSCYHDQKPEHGTPIHLDLTNLDSIQNVLEQTKPDVMIHLAAITDVDLCEKQKELATIINETATKVIAKQAALRGAFLVYVSTDYVFDGKQGMKKEADVPNPVDFYGKSKLGGERAVQDMASGWCIARTSTPFGLHKSKKSFPVWVIENLEAKKEINVLVDQFTSPTYVPNLSKMLIEIATRQITGIIHVAGATRISRYGMAELVAEKLGLDKTLLKKTTIDEMDWFAKRPADSSLGVSFASQILNQKPQEISQSLDHFTSTIKSL